jgi:hypothetical protein
MTVVLDAKCLHETGALLKKTDILKPFCRGHANRLKTELKQGADAFLGLHFRPFPAVQIAVFIDKLLHHLILSIKSFSVLSRLADKRKKLCLW